MAGGANQLEPSQINQLAENLVEQVKAFSPKPMGFSDIDANAAKRGICRVGKNISEGCWELAWGRAAETKPIVIFRGKTGKEKDMVLKMSIVKVKTLRIGQKRHVANKLKEIVAEHEPIDPEEAWKLAAQETGFQVEGKLRLPVSAIAAAGNDGIKKVEGNWMTKKSAGLLSEPPESHKPTKVSPVQESRSGVKFQVEAQPGSEIVLKKANVRGSVAGGGSVNLDLKDVIITIGTFFGIL